jgi:hypothetical protein
MSIIEFHNGQEAALLAVKQLRHRWVTFRGRAAELIIGLMT